MKNVLFVFLMMAITFYGCKKSSSESSHDRPPSAVSNPQPASGAVGVPLPVTLYWSASVDPDGDNVVYDIYLDTIGPNPKPVINNWPYNYFEDPSLVQGKQYYWKIVAKDLYGHQTTGPVWSFKTLNTGPGSQAPETPENPYPINGSTNVAIPVTLSWSKCYDPQADPVTYDVYLDTGSNPTTLIAGNIADTFFMPGNLDVFTKYYWKVVARDNHNNVSNGAIWNFTEGDFDYGSFTDTRDGRVYRTIVINGVTWMADNLAYTPPDNSAWLYPGRDLANDTEYGKLYQNVYMASHNLAPAGWRVANDDDYTALFSFIGHDAGNLKEKGFAHWLEPNTSATDAVGFDARAAGDGADIGLSANFIEGQPNQIGFTIYNFMYNSGQISVYYVSTNIPSDIYYSIRCVKE